MAQGLHLSQKMALQQVLAPQLQQSLALLQAPVLELKALVEQELQQNPVLEEMPLAEVAQRERQERGDTTVLSQMDPAEPPADVKFDPATEPGNQVADDFQAEFEKLVRADQEWREYFAQSSVPQRSQEDEEERRQFMLDSVVATTSLQEHLVEQVRLSELTPDQQRVAEMVVGNIDERGYLQSSPNELAFSTNIPVEQVNEVLDHVRRTFHPPGVGACDLRESLLLQLERVDRRHTLEYRIIRDHMDALGRHRFPELARALGRPVSEIQEAAKRIGQLAPRPGRDFAPDENSYVEPEIFVQNVDGRYVVTTNNDAMPHLRISNTYKDLMAQPNSGQEVRDYIREKIRAGKFLIKSLQQRQQTLLNIGQEIVDRQTDFMEQGASALRPMTMSQVAQAVGVHETTVSRAVSGKYMETPQGVLELKYFFTSGIPTKGGTGVSNESVKGSISEMVAAEDHAKPLSDEEIVRRLAERDIVIARRTVAKYRSELNILPSHLRKTF